MILYSLAALGVVFLLLMFSLIGFFVWYVLVEDRRLQRAAAQPTTLKTMKARWSVRPIHDR